MSDVLIMVAPNGARRTRADHPALPVTTADLAATAAACHRAGAGAIHVHIRDQGGRHVLDAGLYRETVAAIRAEAGEDLVVQITSEAVGRYAPDEQQALILALAPPSVSIAVREMFADDEPAAFFAWMRERGIAVQHILYDTADVRWLADLRRRGVIPDEAPRLLYVLGRYAAGEESDPADLEPFLATAAEEGLSEMPWSVCAFGRGETAALAAALRRGGHVRVGFENSLWHEDGGVAVDNAERVAAIADVARELGRTPVDGAAARAVLGVTRT
jgi:3-keto-5-aminohexanoate cleavage enzyme